MKAAYAALRAEIAGTGLRADLLRGGIGSLIIKVVATLLGFLVAVVLARALKPHGYGVYTYVFTLISMLAIPAQLGLPMLIVRETAKAEAAEDWALMRGLWRWGNVVAGALGVMLGALSLLIVAYYRHHFTAEQLYTFIAGLVLVPIITLGELRSAALRGLRRVIAGQLPETILRPALFVLLLGGSLLVLRRGLTPFFAMELHVVAAALAFVVGAVLLRRVRPTELSKSPKPRYLSRSWVATIIPLGLASGITLITQKTDILMLGWFDSAASVGVYRVAMSTSALVSFGLGAITSVVAPHFSRLHAQQDRSRLQRLATYSGRAILALAIVPVLVFVLLGSPLLGFVFGQEYAEGGLPLALLTVGPLISVLLGANGALLNMTGYERDTVRAGIYSALLNALLNLALIPFFGMSGAAISTAMATSLWSLFVWRIIKLRTGIESSPFCSLRTSGSS